MDKPTINDLQRWLKYNIDECIHYRKNAGIILLFYNGCGYMNVKN